MPEPRPSQWNRRSFCQSRKRHFASLSPSARPAFVTPLPTARLFAEATKNSVNTSSESKSPSPPPSSTAAHTASPSLKAIIKRAPTHARSLANPTRCRGQPSITPSRLSKPSNTSNRLIPLRNECLPRSLHSLCRGSNQPLQFCPSSTLPRLM